jgi:hypothetical protein
LVFIFWRTSQPDMEISSQRNTAIRLTNPGALQLADVDGLLAVHPRLPRHLGTPRRRSTAIGASSATASTDPAAPKRIQQPRCRSGRWRGKNPIFT